MEYKHLGVFVCTIKKDSVRGFFYVTMFSDQSFFVFGFRMFDVKVQLRLLYLEGYQQSAMFDG